MVFIKWLSLNIHITSFFKALHCTLSPQLTTYFCLQFTAFLVVQIYKGANDIIHVLTLAVNFHAAWVFLKNFTSLLCISFFCQLSCSILPLFFSCVWLKCLKLSAFPEMSEAKDTITFRLSPGLERKASSPKASLRAKQEVVSRQRRSPSPPSQGKYYATHNSFLSTY